MDIFTVKNKTILITGASRGIGKSLALGFKAAGANVYGTGTKPESISWMAKADINGLVMNVCNREHIFEVIHEIISKTKKIDCLINNAGVTARTPISFIKDQELNSILNVNLKGTLWCAQIYNDLQKKQSGSIINIASVAAYNPLLATATYSASKAAIIQLTKSMGAEWAKKGIRVNAICPGIFKTDMSASAMKNKRNQNKINASIPMKRPGQVEELLGAAIYLASEASSYMTGQSIVIDGGLSSYLKL